MEKKFYITTPIYYPSADFHIGHCYTTIIADSIARYKRLLGYDVYFQTGTDEHGQKIENKAREAGVTSKEYVDKIVNNAKDLWKSLNISYDYFIRTTDKNHEEIVQKIFKRLYDQGDIYKGEYKGLYCTPCESFWTESQLVNGMCPDCGRKVKEVSEEAYFFRLSKYQDRLVEYIESHPDFILPKSRKNEMINNFIKPGLDDLCVSRTSFTWGIPVTFDPKHVIYVWVDALSNYITSLGYMTENDEKFKKYWPCDLHLVGKEIVRFHTIIWPAMLMALGLELPKQVFGHGWLVINGGKISKSLGNYKDPREYIRDYGVDAVRYYALREVPFGSDGTFSEENLVNRINADLVNNLGNLVHRTISMNMKYFDGIVQNKECTEDIDNDLISNVLGLSRKLEEKMNELKVGETLEEIFDVLRKCNKYIDDTTPWILAKDESKKARLGTILYNLLESIRIIAIHLSPFLPETSEKILNQLNTQKRDIESVQTFGQLENGICVTKKLEILFQRLDEKEVMVKVNAIQEKIAQKREAEAKKKSMIEPSDFEKVDLRVGKVVSCEKHPDSDKLLILKVDLGEGTPRQIVSGIAKSYTAGQMIGKSVVVVANLKPAIIRGIESNGMLLAGKDDKELAVVEVNDLSAGTRVY